METKNSKTHVLSCMVRGPGPKYKMPGLTGYIQHDPTRKVEPAYTIPSRKNIQIINDVPGPNKYSLYNMTNRGSYYAPAYTLGLRKQEKIEDGTPSPAHYKVEKVPLMNHQKRSPAYTIGSKYKDKIESLSPGPKALLPTCIGPHIPDKKAAAAYTMAFSKPKQVIDDTPGPAEYKSVDVDLVKRKCPAYTMRFRKPLHLDDSVPGPKYNAVKLTKRSPTFIFGIKHSPCTVVPKTSDDD